MTAQEYQDMVHELRRQADEQPDKQKLLWKRQLSQQADYRAEIHELHTELLNMRERVGDEVTPSSQHVQNRTDRSKQNSRVRNLRVFSILLSPGRSTRWILPSEELETPNRPTSSGLQSPAGSSSSTRSKSYSRENTAQPRPGHIFHQLKWGDVYGRAGDDGCELFGAHTEG